MGLLRAVVILAAACLIVSLSVTARAATPFEQHASESTFGVGLGYLNGSTLYHISVYDSTGGIESELEFPLNTMLFGLEGGYVGRNTKGQDAFKIGVQWFMSLDSGSGKLKDSDWLTDNFDIQAPPSPPYPPNSGYPHPGLDIYSESDISLTANIFDIRASYNFWPSEGLAVGPLFGLLYQNFQFDASNVHQVGYGPYAAGFTGSYSGLVLTYEVTYTIPYLGLHSELPLSSKFQAIVDLGYSPFASAEDRDDHVLRKKISTAKTSGSATLAAVTAQWDIEDNDFLMIRGQYLSINTTGTQTQAFYDGSGDVYTGINDKITSKQLSINILFSNRF